MEMSGKIIPVNQTLILLYMFALLDQYYIAYELKNKIDVNPYRDNITMKTDDGKYVEIPQDMRKYAIQKWIEMKSDKNKKHKNLKQKHDDDTDEDRACYSCRKEKKCNDHTLIDTSFQLILCLLIIFTLLYTLSLLRQGILKI